MESGFVLDFSNRSFADFVHDSVQIHIYTDPYQYRNGSKADRLRALWQLEPPQVVGKLLFDLIEYAVVLQDMGRLPGRKGLLPACRKVAQRLLAQPGAPQGSPTPSSPSRVLVVYGQGSADHSARVRELTDRLYRAGVLTEIDQYYPPPKEGWTDWLTSRLRLSDYVVAVCDESFHQSFYVEPTWAGQDDTGQGAELHSWMLALFPAAGDAAADSGKPKYLPVLLDGGDASFIPAELAHLPPHDLSRPEGLSDLLALLTAPQVTSPAAPQATTRAAPEPIPVAWKKPPDIAAREPASVRGLKVFLSYSFLDLEAARSLYRRLEEQGIDVWFSETSLLAGQRWKDEIAKAVETSDAAILCLSERATQQAGYFQKEIKTALARCEEHPDDSMFLLPVRVSPCEVPRQLGHIHSIELFAEDGFDRLLRALEERARQVARRADSEPQAIDA